MKSWEVIVFIGDDSEESFAVEADTIKDALHKAKEKLEKRGEEFEIVSISSLDDEY